MIRNTKPAIDYAKFIAREAWTFAKENPGELLLSFITVAAFDIAESLDGIEEMDGYLFIDQEPGA
ncbi:MAG: hypothetical protein CMF19_03940 [Idiomarinaceae bacterium]|nr:hypothetical protein [Idiomarinaceae bacterium]|tara:strand:- start:238 stop:432 length:195 start_codon:yes stop_codon:yes gene_type:complete